LSKIYYYTDSSGKKHKIIPMKSTLSFPYATEEELKALKKEFAESERKEEN